MSAGNFSEACTGTNPGTGMVDGEDESCGTPGNTPDEGLTGWDIEHGFVPWFTFLFNFDVNKGHNGDRGVDFEVGKDEGDGTKGEILTKKFMRSVLVPGEKWV